MRMQREYGQRCNDTNCKRGNGFSLFSISAYKASFNLKKRGFTFYYNKQNNFLWSVIITKALRFSLYGGLLSTKVDGLFFESVQSVRSKSVQMQITCRQKQGGGVLVCGHTQFSAQCVVHGGSSVPSGISAPRPLTLARTAVVPATGSVFKWATHKSQIRFIHFENEKKEKCQIVNHTSVISDTTLRHQHLDKGPVPRWRRLRQ